MDEQTQIILLATPVRTQYRYAHLTGLWQYSLQGNRYEVKREWVHPIWTKLREDIGSAIQPRT